MSVRFLPTSSRRGTLLLIAMWIVFGLIALMLYFTEAASDSYRASANAAASRQAGQAVEAARRYLANAFDVKSGASSSGSAFGGVSSGETAAATDATGATVAGEPLSLVNEEYKAEAVPVGEAMFWIVGRDPNRIGTETKHTCGLLDESSKLNLNAPNLEIEMLEALPNVTPAMAAAIIDWRDADDEIMTSEGAESSDYEMLDTPYAAKNGEFESLEELRLVLNVDVTAIWGEDVNSNGVLDPNENDGDASWPNDNADGRLDPGLAEYVTVWTREPTAAAAGTTQVNFQSNTARGDLRNLLETTFDAGKAEQVLGALGNNLRIITSALDFYSLTKGILSDAEFQQIEHNLAFGSGDYRVGLVNARTASLEVLACLPGMNISFAQSLVSKRLGLDETSLQSLAWVAEVLPAEILTEVGPWLTTKSYQYSADIVAVGENGRGFQRAFMVFDTSGENGAQVIYRRDRTRLGWPLGEELRQSLMNPFVAANGRASRG